MKTTGGMGGMGGMGDLVRHAQKMQEKMLQVQEDLKQRVVEASAGGGMVTVQVNGAQEILSLKINPEVVDPADVEMLQDTVLAAVKQGLQKAKELAEREMGKVTGGAGLPGMF